MGGTTVQDTTGQKSAVLFAAMHVVAEGCGYPCSLLSAHPSGKTAVDVQPLDYGISSRHVGAHGPDFVIKLPHSVCDRLSAVIMTAAFQRHLAGLKLHIYTLNKVMNNY